MSFTDVVESIERETFRKCVDLKKSAELQEYRCSCGRLLGKFSGYAEIKCPKCGKVNVFSSDIVSREGKEQC